MKALASGSRPPHLLEYRKIQEMVVHQNGRTETGGSECVKKHLIY